VPAEREPTVEVSLVGREVGRNDAELVETEIEAEPLDVGGQLLELCSA
jgi:hypothetical protein